MTQMQQFDGTEHITMHHEPERTSIAAILGLVCSCIGCCGGLTAIPGIFLSIFGIVGISRSRGRIGGMGFAIAGLLVGLLMAALWGGALGAGVAGFSWMEKNVSAPMVLVLRDIEDGNFDGARAAMGPPAALMTDELLGEFAAGYTGAFGSVVSETKGPIELLQGYAAVGELIQNYQGRPNYIPFPLEFDNGMGLVVIEIAPTASNSGSMAPIRIIIVEADGTEYVLPPYDWTAPVVEEVVEDAEIGSDTDTDAVPVDGP